MGMYPQTSLSVTASGQAQRSSQRNGASVVTEMKSLLVASLSRQLSRLVQTSSHRGGRRSYGRKLVRHEGLRRRIVVKTRLPRAESVPRQESLLAAVPTELSHSLFAKARPVSLTASQTLFVTGDEGDGCYRVEEGLLKASIVLPAGGERILAILGPGSVVGELSMIDRGPLGLRHEVELLRSPSRQVAVSVCVRNLHRCRRIGSEFWLGACRLRRLSRSLPVRWLFFQPYLTACSVAETARVA
jgi:hypothetical protein